MLKNDDYIEQTPMARYRWASPSAYEAFQDTKFGIRIHWGIYSIWHRGAESWPFLKMSLDDRQTYNSLYKTWNPAGFDDVHPPIGKDYASGSKQKVMTVSADEFLRRFLIHVLPKGLVSNPPLRPLRQPQAFSITAALPLAAQGRRAVTTACSNSSDQVSALLRAHARRPADHQSAASICAVDYFATQASSRQLLTCHD